MTPSSANRITTPKRWYQLSILQMLVAMAVVAVFAVKNASIGNAAPDRLSEPFSYTIHLDDTPLALRPLQAGWPIVYWHARGTSSAGRVYLATYPTYRPWALAGNLTICAASVVLASVMVNILLRKSRSCPSTPT